MNHRGVTMWPATLAAMAVAAAAYGDPMSDGASAYKRGDFKSALQDIQVARKAQPNNPLIYAAMGSTYASLGDRASALAAYQTVLNLDPGLHSIKDVDEFAKDFQRVGGDPGQSPVLAEAMEKSAAGNGASQTTDRGNAAPPSATRAEPTGADIINALTTTGVYVAPGLAAHVDSVRLKKAVSQSALPFKIVIAGHVGGYQSPDDLALDLKGRLGIPDDGAVLVATPRGIAGASGALSRDDIQATFRSAKLDQAFAQGGLTGASIRAMQAVTDAIRARHNSERVKIMLLILVLLAAIVVASLIAASRRRHAEEAVRAAFDAARRPVEAQRQKAIADFTYVDGYLDLLPPGDTATQAREERAAAYAKFSTANGVLKVARTPDEIMRALPLLQEAEQLLNSCRGKIDKLTGGTGVVMGLMDQSTTSTEEDLGRAFLAQTALKPVENVASQAERDELQREIASIPPRERGVSFFSGRPMPASQLTPVSMVIGGQKRTVMATREEAAAIARGQRPPIRSFVDSSGRYTPWYHYRGYDPYRDYYGGWGQPGFGDLVDLYLLTEVLGPSMWTDYGPWGYDGFGWGMPVPMVVDTDPGVFTGDFGGDYGGSVGDNGGFFGDGTPDVPAGPANAGSFDFFGQQGYNDSGPGFDATPADIQAAGFDTPAADSGAFDPGGFDFGGGGDSGSFDSGGFDSGGGDSGGGGSDW